jgi:putative ABC transport system permease protein
VTGRDGEVPKILERLSRLYPRRIREEYGEEMLEVVRREHARALAEGRGYVLSLGRMAAGLIWNSLLAWIELASSAARRGLALDLRSIARSLGWAPSFGLTMTAVVSIVVAMAVATAGFIRGTLLSPRFLGDPERLVFAWGSNPKNGQLRDVVSGPNFLDLRRWSQNLDGLAAIHAGSAVVERDGRPHLLPALEVTVDFLGVLGADLALGGDFGEEHRTSFGPRAVILSHAFWRDDLGGNPGAIGSALVLDRVPHTIVGVLAEDLHLLGSPDVILPLPEDRLALEDRTFYYYWLIGRLAPGSTPGAASLELSAGMARLAGQDPRLSGWSMLVERVDQVSVSVVRPVLAAVGGAVLLVLLAGAANLANLLLVRTLGRSQELSVRATMGAGRIEIARLVLLETGLLAGAGAALGIAGGAALLRALSRTVPSSVPIPGSAAMVDALSGVLDVPVLLVGLGCGLLSWALSAIPTLLYLRSIRRIAHPTNLGFRAAGAPRGTKPVVVAELALATVLLVAAGLLSRAVDRLLAVDPGVDPERLLTFYLGDLGELDDAATTRYFLEVVRRIEQVPGVERAGASDYVPFQGEDDFMGFRLEDRPPPPSGQGLREEWRRVSEGFFDAAGIAVRRGRGFAEPDYQTRPSVAVVNEAFARKYWPESDPIGRRLRVARPEYGLVEVVGVVEDVPERGLALPAPPTFFVPLAGYPRDNMAFFVKIGAGRGLPISILEEVKEAVWSVDSSQPIDRVFPMSDLVAATVALPRFARALVGQFAAIALGLAAVGLFGVASHTVRTRRRELGIRLALGATPRRLKLRLLTDVGSLALAGLAIGALFGVIAGHAGRALLHGVSPSDPGSVAAGALLAFGAALFSTYVPARFLDRIDPAESIRES